jgi:hypothetical protein
VLVNVPLEYVARNTKCTVGTFASFVISGGRREVDHTWKIAKDPEYRFVAHLQHFGHFNRPVILFYVVNRFGWAAL